MRKYHSRAVSLVAFAFIACLVIVLDRVTKTLAVDALSGGRTKDFIPGLIDFQLVYNTGAAWGILEGARVLFLVMAVICAVAAVLYLLFLRNSTLAVLGMGMIAGGAIGNAIDRASSGEVIDFIHVLFINFPLFNIADSAITVGSILFMVTLLFVERLRPQKVDASAGAKGAEDVEVVAVKPDGKGSAVKTGGKGATVKTGGKGAADKTGGKGTDDAPL
jgi:signal peptidase II